MQTNRSINNAKNTLNKTMKFPGGPDGTKTKISDTFYIQFATLWSDATKNVSVVRNSYANTRKHHNK